MMLRILAAIGLVLLGLCMFVSLIVKLGLV